VCCVRAPTSINRERQAQLKVTVMHREGLTSACQRMRFAVSVDKRTLNDAAVLIELPGRSAVDALASWFAAAYPI
jgi:hypothetical protein